MAYIALKTLKPCKCGGRPTIKRVYGWLHICCRKCGWYPYEKLGPNGRVHGWKTRNEAIRAWIKDTDTQKEERT